VCGYRAVSLPGHFVPCPALQLSLAGSFAPEGENHKKISTFHSTGGALSFLFIVNIVLIYTGIGLALGLVLALTLVLHDKTPL